MDEKSWKIDETMRGHTSIVEESFKTLTID